ncbi:NAD(P)/FAD-dependent oxidoreductase [Haladaptatus sp. ZSTT2]|uniref:NAD(P)/FAD-dependent oxidoreductase n=1 Tax=Haladaptatus sp. ZSTT2 TaxID=3120515 RepID=UPI00300F666A
MTTVVILGAGLAGLVAARRLADAGFSVHVVEQQDAVGGRVQTIEKDGFTLDRGFQVLFTAYPAARRELDFDALDLHAFSPGATIARPGHRATLADPFKNPGALTESLFNREVTFRDKARVLKLRRELTSTDPETFFDGVDQSIEDSLRERGFSQAFIDNFAAPFYGGITLDRSLSTSGAVFDYTFSMLATGDTVVPKQGMGEIAEQLAARARRAGADISLETHAVGVFDGDSPTVELEGETLDADAVVVATDPKAAGELTGSSEIPTQAHSCVTQYYSISVPLETHRRLVLNATDEGPNHVAPLSAVCPNYAPGGENLVSATYLGLPDETDAALTEQTRDALASWFPEQSFGSLRHIHTDRIDFAQFSQPPGIHDRLPDVRDGGENVYLAGDYTQWSSIQGALKSGRVAAEAVIADNR